MCTSRPHRWLPLLGFTLVIAVLGLGVLWILPNYLSRAYQGADRVKAVGDARTAGVTFLIAVGAGLSVWYTSRTYALTREGQVTDRYSKAVAQLGEVGTQKDMVQLGGIYALERIAEDSARDQATIVRVLSAFLQQQAKPQRDQDGTFQPRPVALVAADVLGRLPERRIQRGWLSHAQLQGFYLHRLNLSGADLFNAGLEAVDLGYANLNAAYLREADLRHSNLVGTNFRKADLSGANLESAFTLVKGVTPRPTRAADFSGAKLQGARLHKTDLRGATGLTQSQLDEAEGDAATQLPTTLEPPTAWV